MWVFFRGGREEKWCREKIVIHLIFFSFLFSRCGFVFHSRLDQSKLRLHTTNRIKINLWTMMDIVGTIWSIRMIPRPACESGRVSHCVWRLNDFKHMVFWNNCLYMPPDEKLEFEWQFFFQIYRFLLVSFNEKKFEHGCSVFVRVGALSTSICLFIFAFKKKYWQLVRQYRILPTSTWDSINTSCFWIWWQIENNRRFLLILLDWFWNDGMTSIVQCNGRLKMSEKCNQYVQKHKVFLISVLLHNEDFYKYFALNLL